MTTILLVNQKWFQKELQENGFNVYTCGVHKDFDIVLRHPYVSIQEIKKITNTQVDYIVFLDNSGSVTITGLEKEEIPVIFLSVDTHHHSLTHKYLSEVFDYTLVAQKDYVNSFDSSTTQREWFPLWAPLPLAPALEKKHRIVFTGTLNPTLNPDRVKFFSELQTKVPELLVVSAPYWQYFPYSNCVINQTVRGDLNFRVFESIMCGAYLLTEKTSNGLLDLFSEQDDIETYTRLDVDEATEKIQKILTFPKHIQEKANNARQKVLTHHLEKHRAQRLIELLQTISPKSKRPELGLAINFVHQGLALITEQTQLASFALKQATKHFIQATDKGEKLPNEGAYAAVLCCASLERLGIKDLADTLLSYLEESNPQQPLLSVGRIELLREQNKSAEATELARLMGLGEYTKSVFAGLKKKEEFSS
jgi:hypothetical protein